MNLPLLEISGRIEGTEFIVRTLGQRVALTTVQVAEDERGAYALVAECEHSLQDGFKVRAEIEHDEDLPPGGCIQVFAEGKLREAVRDQVRQQGLDPDAVIILAPYARSFAVYFDSAGNVDGESCLGDSEKPVVN
jgi:hypothetical protein